MIMATHPKLTQIPRVINAFLMYWLDPKDHALKDLCHHLCYWLSYSLNKENRPKVIMPTHPKLTQIPRVIYYIVYVLGRP